MPTPTEALRYPSKGMLLPWYDARPLNEKGGEEEEEDGDDDDDGATAAVLDVVVVVVVPLVTLEMVVDGTVSSAAGFCGILLLARANEDNVQ
jgi:hypothetical protein